MCKCETKLNRPPHNTQNRGTFFSWKGRVREEEGGNMRTHHSNSRKIAGFVSFALCTSLWDLAHPKNLAAFFCGG